MRLLTRKRLLLSVAAVGVYGAYSLAMASSGGEEGSAEHGGPVMEILVELVIILLAAKLGGDLFERFRAPAVLGELVMGIVLGNLTLFGIDALEPFKHDMALQVMAELGVIILLFQVGLESTVSEMMQVGLVSFMAATFGIIAPFFLGWGVGVWFLPEASIYVHLFIGATLTATSVGITARVLKDIGKINTREAKIILGAAVIDDILGLVILAVVTGVITAVGSGAGEGLQSGMVLWIIAKAVLFIVGALIIGQLVVPHLFKFGSRLKVSGVFLSLSLLICFTLAFIAGEVGLAPIVGAFAGGLILEEAHFRDCKGLGVVGLDKGRFHDTKGPGIHHLEELIQPIAIFLVPIFFVRMGMLVDLSTFANIEVLGFAAVLTIAAIVGKQACSLAVFDKTTNRIAIGLGMIPRGEVGLIFAGIGAQLTIAGVPIIDSGTYSAVVIMVILTTLVTPPALVASMRRNSRPT
jgi:Kef-type K+ transport system membrane component KefB